MQWWFGLGLWNHHRYSAPFLSPLPLSSITLLFLFMLHFFKQFFSPSWFSLSFRNFHVSGTVGNNHSHCRNIIYYYSFCWNLAVLVHWYLRVRRRKCQFFCWLVFTLRHYLFFLPIEACLFILTFERYEIWFLGVSGMADSLTWTAGLVVN